MRVAIVLFGVGLVISGALMVFVLLCIPKYWKQQAHYKTERIEKACDSVSAIVAFLIPAALAVATWVFEKTGTTWYGASLALSTLWLLFVLAFTMYIRFNFVWRLPEHVTVGNGQNLQIVRWLTSVMVGLTAGLLFLAIPTVHLAFRPHALPGSSDPGPSHRSQADSQSSQKPSSTEQPAVETQSPTSLEGRSK